MQCFHEWNYLPIISTQKTKQNKRNKKNTFLRNILSSLCRTRVCPGLNCSMWTLSKNITIKKIQIRFLKHAVKQASKAKSTPSPLNVFSFLFFCSVWPMYMSKYSKHICSKKIYKAQLVLATSILVLNIACELLKISNHKPQMNPRITCRPSQIYMTQISFIIIVDRVFWFKHGQCKPKELSKLVINSFSVFFFKTFYI